MAKRKDSQSISITDAPSDAAKIEPAELKPKIEAAQIETAKTETPNADIVPPLAPMWKADAPKSDMPKAAPAVESVKREEIKPAIPTPGARLAAPAPTAAKKSAPVRANRFALLAASVAVAAAFGAVAGALGASGIMHLTSPSEAAPATTAANDGAALQATIGKLRSELASLRTSVDTANKSAHGQFSKIAEHFDRVERAQTERSGKLAKAVEGIERLERRGDASANDVTGSVTASTPAALAAPGQTQQPVVPGWVLRDVYRGVAVLQGRHLGIVEVERGDVLPGVGRIESIKKQGGHWVVVTTKGLITTSMR